MKIDEIFEVSMTDNSCIDTDALGFDMINFHDRRKNPLVQVESYAFIDDLDTGDNTDYNYYKKLGTENISVDQVVSMRSLDKNARIKGE